MQKCIHLKFWMKTSKVQVKIFYEILLANKTLLKWRFFRFLFLSAFLFLFLYVFLFVIVFIFLFFPSSRLFIFLPSVFVSSFLFVRFLTTQLFPMNSQSLWQFINFSKVWKIDLGHEVDRFSNLNFIPSSKKRWSSWKI